MLLVVVALFMTLFFIRYDSLRISIDQPQRLNNGWVFEGKDISLPEKLTIPKDTPYLISHELEEDFSESQVMMIRTSLQNIRVFLDDVLIYEKIYGKSFAETYASAWHFIPLPSQVEGRTISIELSSPYHSMSGTINEVYYGTEVMLYRYLMNTYGAKLIIGFIVLFIGLVVMISDFLMRNARGKGFAYVGLFAVLLSFWMIAESKMLQFFTGSELFIGTLAYISLSIFAIPLITYLTEYALTDYKKPLQWMKYLFIVYSIVITLLHFTSVADFFETVIFTQLLIVAGIITAITSLVFDYKKHDNKILLKILNGFVVIIVFAVFELINFLFGQFENTSLYFSLGIVIIMIYTFVNYVRYILHRLKISYKSEVYQHLAYMDQVVQGKNRLAFERDYEEIFGDEKRKHDLRLILFDLDNLKQINDVYGHTTGDEVIKKAYDIMSEVFKDYGECYRIGGDEFACLYLNTSDTLYEEKRKKLESLANEYNEKTPYHFGVSVGSAVLSNDHMLQHELFTQADSVMYEYRKFKRQE